MESDKRTIHFVSLGCAKNRVDTEVMLGVAGLEGFVHVADPSDAEVIVVNTCGFIGPAKEESIDTILEMGDLKDEGRCEQLVVAGCLSQRYPDQLASEMPEVDHFLGSSDMLKLGTVLQGKGERMMVGHPALYTMDAEAPRVLTQTGHHAYVKIAEGCDRTCSFCAIPSFRGKQRSRPVADVVREVQALVSAGVVEVSLISQDTIAYGRDLEGKPDLAELTEAIAEVEGLAWVRLHYLYPEKLTQRLSELMRDHPKVLPYVDMPLQHASTPMLKRMRRGHGGDRLRKVVDRMRSAVPDLVFRTSFIVGHPGETDADFDELVDFVRWAEFDHVGVFLYSPEEDTRSGEMTDDFVDEKVAKRRHRQLMRAQRPISRDKLKARIATEVEVVVDGVSDESEFLLEGRWWGQALGVDGKVYLANGDAQPGEIRRALVTESADYDLVADLLGPEGEWNAPPGTSKPRRRKVRLRTVS